MRGVPVGDGSVHRIIREVQREFFDPPDLSHGAPRWSRHGGGIRKAKATAD